MQLINYLSVFGKIPSFRQNVKMLRKLGRFRNFLIKKHKHATCMSLYFSDLFAGFLVEQVLPVWYIVSTDHTSGCNDMGNFASFFHNYQG